jgi:hypothetical protein
VNILLAVATSLNKHGETEITHFDIHISVEEDVPKLQIAMDNLMCAYSNMPRSIASAGNASQVRCIVCVAKEDR